MTENELREEISIELDLIETLLEEITSLRKDVGDNEATVREKTAAAAFLAQFYGGIENILKRICRFHSIDLPAGDTWHIDLFKRFCVPPHENLPLIFDDSLAVDMAPFRKFRHVVHHGYGFEFEWTRMLEGIEKVDIVYSKFKEKISEYLESLDSKQ